MHIEQVLNALDSLMTIALSAYWKGEKHCGSDWSSDCNDCEHFQVCGAEADLKESMR